MIEVKLSFSSMAEAAGFFRSEWFSHKVGPAESVLIDTDDNPVAAAAKPSVTRPQTASLENIAAAEAEPAAAKEKKTRKTKEQPAVEESAAGAPNPEAPTYTIEHIRTALADMIARTDFETGTALVREFKTADGAQAARLSELREADWAEFIRRSKVAA